MSRHEDSVDDVMQAETMTSQRSPEDRRRACLGIYNEKLLRILGCWQERDPPWTVVDYIFHTLPRVYAGKFACYEILQCVNIHLAVGNPSQLVEHVLGVEFNGVSAVKYHTLYSSRREIRVIIDVLVDMHERAEHADERVKKILDEANTYTKFIGNYFHKFVSTCVATVFFPMIHFTTVNRKFAFLNWYPYDAYSSPWFEITNFVEGISCVIAIAAVVAADSTLALILVNIVAQFKLLNNKLEHIRDIVLNGMKKRFIKESTDMKTCTDIETSEYELNEKDGSEGISVVERILGEMMDEGAVKSGMKGKDATMETCDGEDDNQVVDSEFQAEFNKKMEECLRCCVVTHQTLIRLTEEVNLLFKHLLSSQVLSNVFLGMCWLYIASMSVSITTQFVMVFGILFIGLLEIAAVSWLADMITAESLRVREAAYACDWLDASEAFKSSLRIIMSRSQQALYIRAAGIPLSRKAAKTVCRAAYYFNMFLTRMYYGTKIKGV